MVGEILATLHNWFIHNIYSGTFEVSGGQLQGVDIAPGQFYRVIGSVYNDGVYKYPEAELTDETFQGAVWTLAVPRDLEILAEEIKAYNEKNQAGPYTSESWGGYSYSKRTGSNGAALSWREVYRSRLARWRKI